MKPIKIISTQKPNILEIRWNPNNLCNYKCEYCPPGSNLGDFLSPKNLDIVIKNFNHLIKKYEKDLGKNIVHLKMAGGEPTLWKDLGKFIELIKKENNINFTIISNGSRTLRWWKEYGHLIDNAHLTYHIAQEKNPDHMIAVADTLFEYNKKVTVKVLMDRKYWQRGLDAIEYMKKNSKHKWFIMVGEVIETETYYLSGIKVITPEDIKLTENQKSFLKKTMQRKTNLSWWWKNRKMLFDGQIRFYESIATLEDGSTLRAPSNTYIHKNWNGFEGWRCNIGLESVYINWDGSLQGACSQKIYGLDYSFNILDEDFVEKFNPEFKPSICSFKNCFCTPETHISKSKLS